MTFGGIKFHLPICLPSYKAVKVIAVHWGFNIALQYTIIISKEANIHSIDSPLS